MLRLFVCGFPLIHAFPPTVAPPIDTLGCSSTLNVTGAGLTGSQPGAVGVYYATSVTLGGRPIYQSLSTRSRVISYIYFSPTMNEWKMGSSYDEGAAVVSSSSQLECPEDVPEWSVRQPSGDWSVDLPVFVACMGGQ